MFCTRKTQVSLNMLRPYKESPAFSRLLRGGLVQPEKSDPQISSQVQKDMDCQRSSLPAKGLLSLFVQAMDTVPKLLWDRRFDKVRLRLKRETPHTKVNIKRSPRPDEGYPTAYQ